MIILDAEEDQFPKISTPLPAHARTNRPSTPSPSLPDYETSQEHVRTGKWRNGLPLSRRWKWTLWGLAAYFVVTVAIGVPLIVIKTRDQGDSYKSPSMLYPTPFKSNGSADPIFNLGAFPVCVDSASVCDVWSVQDVFDGRYFNAHLEYYVPLADTVFVQSNVTYSKRTPHPISGALTVGVNSNASETQAVVKVDMSYTGTYIREQTSVCVVNLNGSDGLFLYVPTNLTKSDKLFFNVSLLFPPPEGPKALFVENFLTSLPYFTQNLSTPPTQVTFGNVALGGYKSNLYIDSLQAEAVLMRSPFGAATGNFSVNNDGDDDGGGDDDDDDDNDDDDNGDDS